MTDDKMIDYLLEFSKDDLGKRITQLERLKFLPDQVYEAAKGIAEAWGYDTVTIYPLTDPPNTISKTWSLHRDKGENG